MSELRAALRAVEPAVLADRLREIVRVDVRDEFVAGSAPTLYLAGRHDRLVSGSIVRQMQRLRPDMETAFSMRPTSSCSVGPRKPRT